MADFKNATKGWLANLQVQSADIGADVVVAADIAANAITATEISTATITNAKLSSPEGFFQMHTRIAKRAANQAKVSVAFMGRLPAAGVLVKVLATASVINNIALATPPLCVWIGNATSRLLTGSGLIVPSTAFRVVSAALSTLCVNQAANAAIYVSAKTSTTTSALGVDVISLWKLNHTT